MSMKTNCSQILSLKHFPEADHDWLSGCNSSMSCVHVWQDYNASIKVEHNLHDHNLQQTEIRSSQNWASAFRATPSARDFCEMPARDFCEMPEEHFSGNSGDVGFKACNTSSLGIRPSQQAPRSDGQMQSSGYLRPLFPYHDPGAYIVVLSLRAGEINTLSANNLVMRIRA